MVNNSESQSSNAGHVSRPMREHYSHIRLAAKGAALDAISTSLPEAKSNVAAGDVHQDVHHFAKANNGGSVKLLN